MFKRMFRSCFPCFGKEQAFEVTMKCVELDEAVVVSDMEKSKSNESGKGQNEDSTKEGLSPNPVSDEYEKLATRYGTGDQAICGEVARFEEIEDVADDECLVLSVPRCYSRGSGGESKRPSCLPDFGSAKKHWGVSTLFQITPDLEVMARVEEDSLKMFEISEKLNPESPTGLEEKRLVSVWGVPVPAYSDFMGSSSRTLSPTDSNPGSIFQVIVPRLKCAILGLVSADGAYGPDLAALVSKYLPGCLLSKAGSPGGISTPTIQQAFSEVNSHLREGEFQHLKCEVRRTIESDPHSAAVCTVAILTPAGLFIAQLGSQTRAMSCGITGGEALCHSENVGAFSVDWRRPSTPEVLKYSMRALGTRKLIMLGSDSFWGSLPSKEGSRITAGGLQGHYCLPTMCEQLTMASLASADHSGDQERPEGATCAAMNLSYF